MELEHKYEDLLIEIHGSEGERMEMDFVEKMSESVRTNLKSDLELLIDFELVEYDKTDNAYYLTYEGYEEVEAIQALDRGTMLEAEFQHSSKNTWLANVMQAMKFIIYLIVIVSAIAAFRHVRKTSTIPKINKEVLESISEEVKMIINKLILKQINESWKWTGVVAHEIKDINDFGNVIFTNSNLEYYRLIPEELSLNKIAATEAEYLNLLADKEFIKDWEMTHFVDLAKTNLGELAENEKYCLKIPGVVGGKYLLENMGKISFIELISVSGDLAFQIKDLEDGTEVELKIK